MVQSAFAICWARVRFPADAIDIEKVLFSVKASVKCIMQFCLFV